jgi:hypothetical protein
MERSLSTAGEEWQNENHETRGKTLLGNIHAWEVLHISKYSDNRRSLLHLISVPFLFEGIFREKNLMHAITELKIPLRAATPDGVQFVYGTSPKRSRKRTIK